MDLEEVKRLVREAQWFAHLGHAETRPGLHAVTNEAEWADYIVAGIRTDFNLPGVSQLVRGPLWQMDWLPTSLDEEDPIHGTTLKARAEAQGKTAEFRAVRLEMHKLAQVSLRRAVNHPLLHVGNSDLTLAARGAALFACRLAASELITGKPDFWCSLLPLYEQGNWPLGRNTANEVVIL